MLTALKGSQFYFIFFAITVAGVVPFDGPKKSPSADYIFLLVSFIFICCSWCCAVWRGPKKSPRTSSIVQIIFSFWSFEISESILRN